MEDSFLKFISVIYALTYKAVDAVYFNGANQDGCFFVGATSRRQGDLVQTLLYLRVSNFLDIRRYVNDCYE